MSTCEPPAYKPLTCRCIDDGLPLNDTGEVHDKQNKPKLGVNMRTTLGAITLALLAAVAAVADEPSQPIREEAWYEYSLADGSAIPVPCLGPAVYMEGTEHVVTWSQRYYLPTGEKVVSYKFRTDLELHDQDGNTWIGSGEGRGKETRLQDRILDHGGSSFFVAQILFKPVFGDLGMWQMHNVGMIRVTAEGRIIVEHPSGYDWVEIESCVPAKKN